MTALPCPKRRSRVLIVTLSACIALASAGCSMTTNNGDCDAQGGSNAVSCAAAGGSESPDPAGSAALSGSPATGGSPPDESSQPQDPPSSQSPPATSPLSTNIPVLKPVTDPGFTSVWSGTLVVNAAGVRIASSGIYPGSPTDWDLAYQPGGSDYPWQVNNQTSEDPAIFAYTGTGTPGPAWCRRAFISDQLTGVTVAEPGDRDCYVDLHGMVGYWQVTSVGANGPTIAAWFWNGPPPS
jgi:hypothetical protein